MPEHLPTLERTLTPQRLAADFTLQSIEATVDYMESAIQHDELPPIYDTWVAALRIKEVSAHA